MKTEVFHPSLLVPIPSAAPKAVSFLLLLCMHIYIYCFYFITKLTYFGLHVVILLRKYLEEPFRPVYLFLKAVFAFCGCAVMNQKDADGRLGHFPSSSPGSMKAPPVFITRSSFGSELISHVYVSSWNTSYTWWWWRPLFFPFVL